MFFDAVGFSFNLCSWIDSCEVEYDNDSLKNNVNNYVSDDPISTVILYDTIDSWNTVKVTSLNQLFWYKTSFNRNISKWDVSRVKDMDVSIF